MPNNIDEVIGEMTLEEKVHMVIGCGMSMGDGAKFPGTAGRTYDIARLGYLIQDYTWQTDHTGWL